MLQYSSMEKTRKLLTGIIGLAKKYTTMRTLIILDPNSSQELYNLVKTLSDRELPVQDDWL